MSSDQKIDASSLLVTSIKGVGEKLSQSLLKLGIKTIEESAEITAQRGLLSLQVISELPERIRYSE